MKFNFYKALALVLCLATLFSFAAVLSSCNNKKAEEKMTVIVEGAESSYVIIRQDKIEKSHLDTILQLREAIMESTGCNIDMGTDWVKSPDDIDPSAKEILVGNTNRPETAEVLETLKPNEWAVVNKGNKIVICTNNDALLSLAIDWFIKNCINSKDKTVKVAEKLVKTEGFGEDLPISVGGISSFQVVYPKGDADLEYYASLIKRKAYANAVVSDDKSETDNEIIIGNTKRGKEMVSSDKNEYSITTEGTKVYVNASDKRTLYYAVNYYIEYGLNIGDTVVSSPADYSKSGSLANYYASNWSVDLPCMDNGKISPAVNIGTGMENDLEKNTITDSYMHIVTGIEYATFEKYAKKLESFGFKKIYSGKTEDNELWGYRLGAAYAYMHYSPLLKQIRIVWDKSSNCEISDFEFVSDHTGTTTFYQYSIDYGHATMNYSGVQGWGLFDVVKLQDNSLILVDGGSQATWSEKSLKGLCDFLYEITGNEKKEPLNIRLWYYTHSDSDHTGLAPQFVDYLKGHGYKAPTIETLAFNFPNQRTNSRISKDGSSYQTIEYMNKNYPDVNYLKIHTGMVFNLGEVKFEVLGTVENCFNTLGSIADNYSTNDTCSLVSLTFGGKKFIITGDVGRSQNEYSPLYSPNYFKCDVYQVSHHGINILSSIDKFSRPQYALVPNAAEEMLANNRLTQYQHFESVFGDKLHYAGNYTTAISVSNGTLTMQKIPRYDNPTGVVDDNIK